MDRSTPSAWVVGPTCRWLTLLCELARRLMCRRSMIHLGALQRRPHAYSWDHRSRPKYWRALQKLK